MLDGAGRFWEVLGLSEGSGRCWEVLGGVGRSWRCWKVLGGPGRSCKVLEGSGRCWEALGSPGRCRKTPRGPGDHRVQLFPAFSGLFHHMLDGAKGERRACVNGVLETLEPVVTPAPPEPVGIGAHARPYDLCR